MMTDWYQRSINALQLNGKGERTQEAYTRAVRMLSTFYSKPPDEIAETELEAYFLRRRNVDHWSPNTMRICYCGIRFFFVHVLQRNWHLFDILRAKSEARLPAILSVEEVRAILRCVRTPHNHAFLSTVYACGLRLQEAQYLEVSDIDSRCPSGYQPAASSCSQIEQPVGRAPHPAGPTVEDVRLDLGRADIPVTEELLHGADVVVVLEEVGGEGVRSLAGVC